MGTTFISIEKDKGFWIRDVNLELFLRFASLHIEDSLEVDSIENKIRIEWLLASRGYFNGAVPFHLQRNVETPEGKKVVVDAITSLLQKLNKLDGIIDAYTCNLMGIDGEFVNGYEPERLIEVGECLLQLIDGKIGYRPDEKGICPGSNVNLTKGST